MGVHRTLGRRLGLLGTSMLGAMIVAAPAFAQEAPQSATEGANDASGEIIVTATRKSEALSKVPLSVSAFSTETLDKRGVRDFSDVIRQTPGVVFEATNTTTNIAIRGINSTVGAATTGVYIDDTPIQVRALGYSGGNAYPVIFDLERIEVLRGPQGSLFGKNASAGVINIITRDPPKAFGGYLDAAWYEGNEFRVRGSVGGALGEGLTASLTGFYAKYDGNGVNVFNGHKINGYEHWGLRGKVVYQPNDTFKLTVIGDYAQNNDNGYADSIGQVFPGAYTTGVFIPSLAPLTLNDRNKNIDNDLDPLTRDRNSGVSAQMDIDLGGATLTSITAYRHWYNYQQRDGDFRSDAPKYVAAGAAASDVLSHDRGDLKFDQFTQELRVASSGKQFLEYVAGLYYYHTKEVDFFNRTVKACTASTLAPVNGLTPCDASSTYLTQQGNADFTTKLTSYSAFGQATANFTPTFRGIIGSRYTHDKVAFDFSRRSTSATAFPGVNPAFAATGATAKDGWSGNVGLQYDVDKDVMAYGTYTRGYKGPAINVFFNMLARDTGPIAPEKSDAYEIGLKTRLFDRRLTFNIAAFYAKYNNYQANFLDLVAGQVVTRLTNAGSVSTRGVEVDFNASLTDNFSLNGGFNYTDAHINKFNCPTGAAVTCADAINGKPLPFAPKYKGTVTADWRLPLGLEAFNVDLNTSVVYQSKTSFDINQNPYAIQTAYALWDLGVTVRTKDDKYSVSFIAKNLTDKHFVIQRIPNGTAFMRQITPRDAQRYFGVSARMNF